MQLFNTPLSEGRACLCVLPLLGDGEGDKKKIPPEMSDIRQFTPVFFFATLPYRSARVVFVYGKDSFFSGSIFVCCGFSSVFVSELRSRGNGGEPPY